MIHGLSKIKNIVDSADKKAKSGCNIDFTFVRFIYDNSKYIDIPFEVFASKKNLATNKRNSKLWHRENIKRILVNNPDLKNIDEEMIKEAIDAVLIEENKK